MKQHILIVDDEPDIRKLLAITLERMGHSTRCTENLQGALTELKQRDYNLCITDLKLPDGSGLDLVKTIQTKFQALPVIVITAHGTMDIAIDAMKNGAFDFLNKPIDLKNLRSLISSALTSQTHLNKQISGEEIIGKSEVIDTLKQQIVKVARSQAPVFISGESGSGKELTARAIHKLSARCNNPFVAVNCGAIPKEIMESELFGHMKGSFTGAVTDKRGLFQSAQGGTLFLDEVGDLPIDMQVKLLRAIQEKYIRPVGGDQEIQTDVRILSATHKNLQQAIEQGNFRSDLYYRINVIELKVPSLRERMADLPELCNTLLDKIAHKNQQSPQRLTPLALSALSNYPFPGNIRELENILERACALCTSKNIDSDDLHLQNSALLSSGSPTKCNDYTATPYNVIDNVDEVRVEKPASETANTPANESSSISKEFPLNREERPIQAFDPNKESLDDYLFNIEKSILTKELIQHRWNRTAAAKSLGITFRSLRYRLKKLNLDE